MNAMEKRRGRKDPLFAKNQEDGFSSLQDSFRSENNIEEVSTVTDLRTIASQCLQRGDLLLLQGDAETAHDLYRQALYLSRSLPH